MMSGKPDLIKGFGFLAFLKGKYAAVMQLDIGGEENG